MLTDIVLQDPRINGNEKPFTKIQTNPIKEANNYTERKIYQNYQLKNKEN